VEEALRCNKSRPKTGFEKCDNDRGVCTVCANVCKEYENWSAVCRDHDPIRNEICQCKGRKQIAEPSKIDSTEEEAKMDEAENDEDPDAGILTHNIPLHSAFDEY